ncbi:LOW QUALITY PROTEIN: gamma-tubulin complex component 5-like [Coccinella septempunctata]|uniref:LOW QUALITY PROTEIN: gamma-tubulin complex component 5-like n=1 Tax=Coccinella septempunctata TaxID=41139 RepID=UPI001D070413|nr:LOW QUALITY PROTEIN: gamma-tubulin complex component 5-like [Coccinella septempunctata]
MNIAINKEVRNLIEHILGDKDNLELINAREKQVISKLKKGDTMSFVNKREMDLSIQKMAEKYEFHGFSPQAEYLRKMYDKYMGKIPKQDLHASLNTLRFLLYMSESPTIKFMENPEEYLIAPEEDEKEVMNWGEYLLEGIEIYTPEQFDDTSDESSGFQTPVEEINEIEKKEFQPILESASNVGLRMNFDVNQELKSTIQHTWYNMDYFSEKPASMREEANVGILWEDYLESETHGLLGLDKISFISEYKVIREIIWQMFGMHKSFVFYFKGNELNIRSDVSIASVRNVTFNAFLQQFLQYIELLEFFRTFIVSTQDLCQTYVCYGIAIRKNILEPIYKKLIDIEEIVRKQEETYTLLRLANDLGPIFEPLQVLKELHDKITVCTDTHSALYCATSLLCNLHSSLRQSSSKLENDIKLTLYLESLFKYFTIIDSWLSKNDFFDGDLEFVLVQTSSTQTLEYKTCPLLSARITYVISDGINEGFQEDGVIKIICTRVLHIANNIRLLFHLRKFDFYYRHKETLYEELVKRFLTELCRFFKYRETDVLENLTKDEEAQEPNILTVKHPIISVDNCRKATEMDKLENLVDTNNGFLMKAFENFCFVNKQNVESGGTTMTLLERICKITTGLFPLRNTIERIFLDILKERYSVCGLMVKNTLVEDHHLDKLFEFLRALFLFSDASLFPFFQQFFFEVRDRLNLFQIHFRPFFQMEFLPNSPWRYMRLSSNLKDLISEKYPSISANCEVTLRSIREQSADPLDICDNLNIKVVLRWPLSVVVADEEIEVYNSIFHFLVKLKWALHALNSLSLKDIFGGDNKSSSRLVKNTVRKLQVFRFSLLQLLNFIHHYVLCFCLMKCLKQFELDFEKSNDLDSVIKSHCDFVEEIENMVAFLNDKKDNLSFNSVLHCVKILKSSWYNLEMALDRKVLDSTHQLYENCKASIESRVNRVYLMSY